MVQGLNDLLYIYYNNKKLVEKYKKKILYINNEKIHKSKKELNDIEIERLETLIKINSIEKYVKESVCPHIQIMSVDYFTNE